VAKLKVKPGTNGRRDQTWPPPTMATKFMKNNKISPPPPPHSHPLSTNHRAQNLPPAPSFTTPTRTSTSMAWPSSFSSPPVIETRRSIKRGRESSEEENSSDDDRKPFGPGYGVGGGLPTSTRKLKGGRHEKRARKGDHQWTLYQSPIPTKDESSDEDDEEEADLSIPSPLKR